MNQDLTVGKPGTVLWKFCLPMFGSIIFQQLYNIADSLVAGKFVGEEALAAVGNGYEVTLLFIAVAFGCNIGCSVVTARKFGAKQYGEMKTAVHTALIASGVLCAGLMVIGLGCLDGLLTLIHTPENVFADSRSYLEIYILSLPFVFYYNVATGIFSALGDSRTPFVFLVISSLSNIGADILFVTAFDMGVPGVAWATLICQGVSCILAMVVVFRRLAAMETGKAALFSWKLLGQIAVVAVPSMLQQSFISVGNMILQGIINGFGSGVMAGYSAAIKLNTFAVTCFSTLSNGLSSFTAQNMGAGKKERMQEGYKAGILLAVIICIPFVLFYFFGSRTAMGLFMDANESQEAINTGIMFLKTASPFYLVMGIKVMSDGLLRGASAMVYFMTGTFMDLILRVILAYIFAKGLGFGSTGIWMAWPFGWTISMFFSAGFCKMKPWEKS